MKHSLSIIAVLCLSTLLVSAMPQTLLNYTFSGTKSDAVSSPTFTSGDFTLECTSIVQRTGCIRVNQTGSKVSISYLADFQNGDIISINWKSMNDGANIVLSSGEVNISTIEVNKDVVTTSEIVVGSEDGQFNIAGKKYFEMTHDGSNSFEINTLTIIGEPREIPEPEAGSIHLLDYTFPGKSSSHSNYVESLPAYQARQNFIISYSDITADGLRGTCIRLHQSSCKVTVSYPGTFLAGDSVILNWTSKAAGTYVVLKSISGTAVNTGITATGGDVPLSDTIIVGGGAGQLDIAGQITFTMQRGTDNSVELRSITIIGETRDIPEQEQLVVSDAMIWDWTLASDATKVTPASTTDTLLMSSISDITTYYEIFDSRYIMMRGENAVRNGDACQSDWLMLKLAKPGHIKVTFCSVGDASKGQRYLFINGENTEVYSENTETIDPKIVEKDVPAGELVFTAQRTDKTGNQAIRIMRIEYTPFSAYERSVTAGRYGTICLAKASTMIEGAVFYKLVEKQTSGTVVTRISMEEVTETEAGVPYIFLPEADNITVWQFGDAVGSASDENGLYGSFTEQEITGDAGDPDLYILSGNTLYPTGAHNKVGAGKAYIKMSEVPDNAPAPVPGRRRVTMQVAGSNTATTIEYTDADAEGSATALLIETQSDPAFDILGRPADAQHSQIIIVNGKKMMIVK